MWKHADQTQGEFRDWLAWIHSLTLFYLASCDKCNFNAAYFYQLQIRSADEPMTTCEYTTFSFCSLSNNSCFIVYRSVPVAAYLDMRLNESTQMCSMRSPMERKLTHRPLFLVSLARLSSSDTRRKVVLRSSSQHCVCWPGVPWLLSAQMGDLGTQASLAYFFHVLLVRVRCGYIQTNTWRSKTASTTLSLVSSQAEVLGRLMTRLPSLSVLHEPT